MQQCASSNAAMASNNPKAEEMESLKCSLCLDVFEEAKLLRCGHTFCRKCLEKYAQCHSHQHPEGETLSMLCPLCRQETDLGAGGVTGLSPNVSLNHLVEEFNNSSNPLRKLYEDRQRCSQCGVKQDDQGEDEEVENPDLYAVVFCCDCDLYLCEGCLTAHKKFELNIFKGHRVVPVKEILSGGRSSLASQFDKCPEHTSEAREFYCADCRAIICHKCTIVKHNVREHKILERGEVESEIRGKISDLITRHKSEKDNLEAFIRETELERRNAKVSLHEVLQDIDDTFSDLQRQLEERKKTLKSEVEAIDVSCDEKFDSVKFAAQKLSSQLSAAQDMLECRDGHSCLEGDALVSHEHLLTEVEELLKASQSWIRESQEIPGNVSQKAVRLSFDVQTTDISYISQIGRVTDKKWKLFKEVELPYEEPMSGLAVHSPESILVVYYNNPSDNFLLDGSRTPSTLHSSVLDATVLSDGRLAVVERGYVRLFGANGNVALDNFKTPKTKTHMMVDSDGKDQIYVACWDDKLIQVFIPDGGDPIREIKLPLSPYQVHSTKCGHLVIQSSVGVRVLDERNNEITITTSGYTYPAVDKNDNLYIATIDKTKSTVSIKRYTLDGVLKRTVLDDVKIKIPKRGWYYMKCPSPDVIVFCTAGMMYVFKNVRD